MWRTLTSAVELASPEVWTAGLACEVAMLGFDAVVLTAQVDRVARSGVDRALAASHLALARKYAPADRNTALIRLRRFGETVARVLAAEHGEELV